MCLCLCNCLINISSIEENVSFIWKVLAAVHWSIMCSHFYISAWHCPCCLLYSGAVCECVCVCVCTIECVNEYPATTTKTNINFHHHRYTAISWIRNSMINYNNIKYALVSVLFSYTHIHTCTHKRVNWPSTQPWLYHIAKQDQHQTQQRKPFHGRYHVNSCTRIQSKIVYWQSGNGDTHTHPHTYPHIRIRICCIIWKSVSQILCFVAFSFALAN